MARKVFRPISQKFGEREIYRDQDSFQGGMIFDAPHSEIPDNAVAKLVNAHVFPWGAEGRRGTKVWSTAKYPRLRSGLKLTKADTIVTATQGDFLESDVSNYIVWDDGFNTKIVRYISATQVEVNSLGDKTAENAYIRGQKNAVYWHPTKRWILMHMGQTVYYCEGTSAASWTAIQCISADKPSNNLSQFDDLDDNAVLNSGNGGLFKVVLDDTFPYIYRMNTFVPDEPVDDVVRRDYRKYGRRYLYSMSRMSRQINLNDRETLDNPIIQESGTCALDENREDYGEVWTQKKRGDGTKTQGRLVGATLADADMDVGAVWGVINDGTFNISFQNIFVDFTGVSDMTDVAARIELAMQAFFPDYTCDFETDHFVITSGEVDETTLTYISDGAGGTNIADNMLCRVGDGASLDNAYVYEDDHIITGLALPHTTVDGTAPQWHWTHYSIYATLDIGEEGTNPVTGVGNNPERYIWLRDLRIAAAFFASKAIGGLVTASHGEFEQNDVGSVLEWENGDRDTITAYIDAQNVMVETGSVEYEEAYTLQACAIGDGNVRRASQSGTTVTLTTVYNSETFSSADVGKTIWWSNGYRSVILEVYSGTSVRVNDNVDKQSMGITIDPQSRNFNDTVNDEALRLRQSAWLLKQRFWVRLPRTNMVVTTSGFLFVAERRKNILYYSQMPIGYKYLGGYYNPAYQFDENVKDGIQHMDEYTNRIVVWGARKWYAGPVNESSELSVPEVGEVVVVFNGLQVGEEIGLFDWGSYQKINKDTAIMITSEPAVRVFNGYQFGENLAENQDLGMDVCMRKLRSWWRATASMYHPNIGYIVWGRKKS